jgi:hypothetical protein
MWPLRIFWAFAVFSFFVLGRLPFIRASFKAGGSGAAYTVVELLLVAYLILWILFGKAWIRYTIGRFKRGPKK